MNKKSTPCECFCGEHFPTKYSYKNHSKCCEIYQFMKEKYLSYYNLRYLYMIRRMMFKEIREIYPYNMFCFVDFLNAQMNGHFPQFKILKSGRRLFPCEIDSILNYEFLYDCYINKQMSTFDIAELLNNDFNYVTISRKLTDLKIEKRDAVCACKTERHKTKQASDFVQDKSRNTCMIRYGVPVSSQCERVKNKAKEKSRERYGTDYPIQNKSVHAKSLKNRKESNGSSKIATKMFDEICHLFEPDISCNFKYATHGAEKIIFDNDLYRCYCLDFSYDKDGIKFDIEFNGDYYHMNPKMFTEDDNCLGKKASDIWIYDKERKEYLESQNYKVLTIWEDDYLHNHDKVIHECKNFIDTCLRTKN